MKNFTSKFVIATLIFIAIILVQTNIFATNEKIQIIDMGTQYIVYVQNFLNKDFKYAVSNEKTALEPGDIKLHYINSVKDENGKGENSVAVITEPATFLYVKDGEKTLTYKLDFTDTFSKEKMEYVEKTTKRIQTEVVKDLIEREEEIDGIKYKETVDALKITDEDNATYEYIRTKLPAEKYTELQDLADELSTKYSEKNMYEKIEFAKRFFKAYDSIIKDITVWVKVQNMEIKQPLESKNGDKYVVILKKTSNDGKETYDAKFLVSYRDDEEEKIPAKTETKVVQETSKLPITSDSLWIGILLIVVIVGIIAVLLIMKKMKKDGNK